MTNSWQLPRRTFLKGLGTAIALPMFEAMMPGVTRAAALAGGKPLPKRMAFVYVPNGANMADWTPKAVGSDFELPYILEPLKSNQKDLRPEILIQGVLSFYDRQIIARRNDAAVQDHKVVLPWGENDTLLAASRSAKQQGRAGN